MKKYFSINILVPFGFFLLCIIWLRLALALPNTSSVTLFAGPSTFPTVVLVIMLISSIIVLIQEVKVASKGVSGEHIEKSDLIRMTGLLLAIIIYVMIIEQVGFIISTILLMFVSILLFGQKNKIVCAVVPVGMTAFIYVIFQYVLKINMP